MTSETAQGSTQGIPEAGIAPSGPPPDGESISIDPDLDFIRALSRQGGEIYKKCMQCGTCSLTCDLSTDTHPFPRKELAWAVWGMKDRLLSDPDVWLCHQCNDCSTRCPRTARPGNVMAAIRQEAVMHYAFPRFLARWVNHPQWAPLLFGIPVALLALLIVARQPLEEALGLSREVGSRIVYTYSSVFPHWLLNGFFGLFSLLALIAVGVGVARFWRALKAAVPAERLSPPAMGLGASILTTLKDVFTHDKFDLCTRARPRTWSHALVIFGFLALTAVTLWVITASVNPLIRADFVYPFAFLNPWKVLANLGGAALVAGLMLMARDRLRDREEIGLGTYFDWALLTKLFLVALTGYITEALHFLRLEPHRHIAYFIHLVFVFVVLIYLPYSKLAHLAYRFTAMVFAAHSGREWAPDKPSAERA